MQYDVVDDLDGDPLIGVVFDERFRVDAPISRGGMGKVYRGSQVNFERDVAIKVLKAEATSQKTKVRRFLREAQTISQLSHPNIVNFIDFGQDAKRNVLYLVMELIEGCELTELLRGSRLEPKLATEIALQICSALTEPHHHGVIHRDLKPANLMLLSRLDGSMQVKLVDFGIANAVHQKTRLTRTGVACGTPHYMAPEQVDGSESDPTTDIYGLGAILFHMLAGEVVFDAKSDVQILFKHLKENPPSLAEARTTGEFPDALVDLVDQMLEKEAEARPDSVLEVRDRLKEIRSREGWGEVEIDPNKPPDEAFAAWVVEGGGKLPFESPPRTGSHSEPPDTGGDVPEPDQERVAGGEASGRVGAGTGQPVREVADSGAQDEVAPDAKTEVRPPPKGPQPEETATPESETQRIDDQMRAKAAFEDETVEDSAESSEVRQFEMTTAVNVALSVIGVLLGVGGVVAWQFAGASQRDEGVVELGDRPEARGANEDTGSVGSKEGESGEPNGESTAAAARETSPDSGERTEAERRADAAGEMPAERPSSSDEQAEEDETAPGARVDESGGESQTDEEGTAGSRAGGRRSGDDHEGDGSDSTETSESTDDAPEFEPVPAGGSAPETEEQEAETASSPGRGESEGGSDDSEDAGFEFEPVQN